MRFKRDKSEPKCFAILPVLCVDIDEWVWLETVWYKAEVAAGGFCQNVTYYSQPQWSKNNDR